MSHPLDVAARDSADFLAEALPPAPLAVLEVGAGAGRLAALLAARGYRVSGLDHDPAAVAAMRRRGVTAIEADFPSYETHGFDVVLFSRVLHHLSPLAAAVARARAALVPGGIVVAEEFAFERVDPATLRWLDALRAELGALGELAPVADARDAEPAESRAPLERWLEHHRDVHQVHPGEAMVRALEREFVIERVLAAPYLYRYLADELAPDARGADRAAELLERERRASASSEIRAVGLRVVGRARVPA